MDEIRSCDRCKYGPNMVACHAGRTGNLTFQQSLSKGLQTNPFLPDPLRDSTSAFLLNPDRMPCFQPRVVKNNFGSAKVVLALLMPFLIAGIGFVLGIIPGLLLGLINWHEGAAIVIPIIWCIGYIRQRSMKYHHIDWITFCVGGFGGLGLGIAIWVFGNITMSN